MRTGKFAAGGVCAAVWACFVCPAAVGTAVARGAPPPPRAAVIMVDDFDGEQNSLSNMFGTRALIDPGCCTPICTSMQVVEQFFSGKALQLNYNHTCGDAGWSTDLGGQDPTRGRDLSDAQNLRFRVMGALSTTRIRVRLTDATGASATADVTGIDGTWTERVLDVATSFSGVDAAQLAQLAFVVPQGYSDDVDGVGVLYFDEIFFETATAEPTTDEDMLLMLAQRCFRYFWDLAHPVTGLCPDRATNESASSVAGVGYQLSSLPIGVRHGWVTRAQAAARATSILQTLLFSAQRPDGAVADESVYNGYKGFFYHFLDSATGLRAGASELSTIDSTLCYAGVIDVMMFFDGSGFEEVIIRNWAQSILDRVDWAFFFDSGANQLRMAWTPESGFAGLWDSYTDEVILMTLFASSMGSNPVPSSAFFGWDRSHRHYNSYAMAPSLTGSLFTYYQAHGWLDLRGRTDRHPTTPVNWFRNGWAATVAQRDFALSVAGSYATFGPDAWGLSDSSTPGSGYQAVFAQPRLSGGPDVHNGTVAPSAAASTLPLFACASGGNLALDAVRNFYAGFDDPAGAGRLSKIYGLVDAYNETGTSFWYGNDFIALAQGASLLAIENYVSAQATAKRVSSYSPLAAAMDAVMWPAFDSAEHIVYAREGEQFDSSSGTPGMNIEFHADASSTYTLQLGETAGNYVEYVVKSVWTAGALYLVQLQYSDGVPGNEVAVEWDGLEVGRFTTGSSGGWDSFVGSPRIEIGSVGPGDHTVRVVNISGGTFGFNLDVIHVFSKYRPADFDTDCDVDLLDYGTFAACLGGPNVPPAPGCAVCDLEEDGDVDANDFAHFQVLFTGP